MKTSTRADPGPRPTATVVRHAAHAEWTRLSSLRSTWWCIAAAACLMLFIAAAAGAGHAGDEPAPIWQAAQIGMIPAQFAFLAVVLLVVGGEYGTGAIRSTMQWTPRRDVLLAVRVLVPVIFTTACAVVLAAASNLIAWTLVGDAAEVITADIAASIGRIGVVVTFGGFLAAGLGLLLRSTAGTTTALFLLLLALPIALGNTGVSLLTTISDALPGRAVISLLVTDQEELPPSTIALVTSGWTITALLLGGRSLLRRDAS